MQAVARTPFFQVGPGCLHKADGLACEISKASGCGRALLDQISQRSHRTLP